MKRVYRYVAHFCVFILAIFLVSRGVCSAQIIWPSPAFGPALPIGITYIPDPLLTLGSLPPIYPYVGDTISAFDSFFWPVNAITPPTSLSEISYAVPGLLSGYPGLNDPQIYLANSFLTYANYLNLYFAAAPEGITLPGAFGPFGLPSVSAYSALSSAYPYFSYGDISSLLSFYALNPISSSYLSLYPIIY